jgi:hypothetical protein
VKLFQWRGRTSKKESRKRFIELLNGSVTYIADRGGRLVLRYSES